MQPSTLLTPRPSARLARWGVFVLVGGVLALLLLPIGLLFVEGITFTPDLWARLWATSLPRMIVNTALLLLGVGAGTCVIGVGMAWLVTGYDFPLRGIFDRALLLPLAVPPFVMGFVYMATFDYAGPVQTAWRALLGRDAWFPPIRSGWGAIAVMTLVLYPYVYLLARASFREQAASTFDAARVMGFSRRRAFFQLVLPMARPSLIAGVTLAAMETLTDFATVRFFAFPTLSEGVVRIWEGRMDRAGATELAVLLLVFALLLITLERALRGRARYDQQGSAGRRLTAVVLTGWRGWTAALAPAIVVGLAFVLPVGRLIAWTLNEIDGHIPGTWETIYGAYIGNSFTLAGAAAAITVTLALLIAFTEKNERSRNRAGHRARALRWSARLATLGYAMPGAVVAAGVLLVVAPIDHALIAAGVIGGLALTGSIVGLLYAYVVRFMAVGYQSVSASLERIKPSMTEAGQTMGAGQLRIARRIIAPLIRGGTAAGVLLVFVDVLKELPATLLLRPFGMDTLAIWSYMLAAESFWQAAALPALTILAISLIPVAVLMRIGR
ncbi:MAG: iron ABC transporter permease [Chloroflexota bacterium]|nr:iron ABC transporter permease [Chloroflexota bacterium]